MNVTCVNKEEKEDRELFSELVDSPILPFLIHTVLPCKDSHNENTFFFLLEINWKSALAIEKGRGKSKYPFRPFQESFLKLGYKLQESSRKHIGDLLAIKIRHFTQQRKMTSGRKRQRLKEDTWPENSGLFGNVCFEQEAERFFQ